MRLSILLLFIVFSNISLAQKEDYIWLFGGNFEGEVDTTFGILKMDFNETPSTWEVLDHLFVFLETKASICDNEGSLVCYTNGAEVYNGQHELVSNGGNLQQVYPLGYFVPQAALILPFPEQENEYVLFLNFLQETEPYEQRIYSSILKMGFNNGAGIVTNKNTLLSENAFSHGLLTACRHANGRDWWITVPRNSSSIFSRFLLSPEGIEEEEQDIGEELDISIGQAIFSPNGEWYASINAKVYIDGVDLEVHLYQFDRCTGLLSNAMVDYPLDGFFGGWTGGTFSSNSRFLYVSAMDSIMQYDMEADDIMASRITVAILEEFLPLIPGTNIPYQPDFMNMQLSPDGKIYVMTSSAGNGNYIHIIHSPDSLGVACDVEQHVEIPVQLGRGTPNYPHFRLGALEGSGCDTLNLTALSEPVQEGLEFIVYPNPTTDYIRIANLGGITKQSQVIFYNTLGEEVLRKELSGSGETELELDLASGIYFYSIVEDGVGVKSGKLVVDK